MKKLTVSILLILFAVLIGAQYIPALQPYCGAAAVGLIAFGAYFGIGLFKEQGNEL